MKFFIVIFSIFFAFNSLEAAVSEKFKDCNEGLGKCVPLSRCSNKTEFNFGNKFTFNVRFDLEDADSENGCHYLEKCCDPENIITENASQTTILRGLNEESIEECMKQCRTDEKETAKLPPKYVGQYESLAGIPGSRIDESCGFRNKRGIGLEVADKSDVAQFGEFPWQIALSENRDSIFSYMCGGSLIHPQVVLTGAHCVAGKNAALIQARAGEWDTQTVNEPFPHSDHKVARVIVHPDFGPKNLTQDVALLVLQTPVKISPHINTICLPPQNSYFDGQTCFASGWGASSYEQRGAYRVNLKRIAVPTIQKRDCQNRLRTTKLGERFKLHTSFMCAGGELNIDACIGDGGGPLVCPIQGESDYFYQAGIVAWGIECGQEGIPGVYADVSKFRHWIDETMEGLGYGTKSYTF